MVRFKQRVRSNIVIQDERSFLREILQTTFQFLNILIAHIDLLLLLSAVVVLFSHHESPSLAIEI